MLQSATFIDTPLQRGEKGGNGALNRFSGFRFCGEPDVPTETAKAVHFLHASFTPLKRGVNASKPLRRPFA